jgi:hypothetical protein
MQVAVCLCSFLFVIGTAIQNFVIIDEETVRDMMRLAGSSPAEAQAADPGFVTGFRIVGCLYIAGNAVGLLAVRGRAWVFWTAVLVNVTQAAGLLMIPPEVFDVTRHRFGAVGLLPSLVTDGGAALLACALVALFVAYRTPWAYQRAGQGQKV